ncbi:hypothetical protein C0583_05530 [Candidatus Parcubacteria bacterium]|nr:MAG: hypothetical protein C0583_05530 [Candidatus Parcubacteria bacterium]
MYKRGFTLVELLIVIGIIAVLAALAFVSLDPLARFQDSRNAQRSTDSAAVLNALRLDQVDNGGTHHANVAALTVNRYYQIGEATTGCDTTCSTPSVTLQSSCVNLLYLIDEGYIADIPIDPSASGASSDMTGYYVYIYDSGQMAVGSCHEELGSSSEIQPIEAAR